MTNLAAKRHAHQIPREVLIFAAVLVAITAIGAGTAHYSGLGRSEAPVSEAVQSLSLRFDDQPDGGVLVRRAEDGATIYRIAPETNGFMRSTMRGLVRERRLSGIGDETPFILTYRKDGQLTLEDPATGRRLGLEAFGETNARAFAQLFQKSGGVR